MCPVALVPLSLAWHARRSLRILLRVGDCRSLRTPFADVSQLTAQLPLPASPPWRSAIAQHDTNAPRLRRLSLSSRNELRRMLRGVAKRSPARRRSSNMLTRKREIMHQRSRRERLQTKKKAVRRPRRPLLSYGGSTSTGDLRTLCAGGPISRLCSDRGPLRIGVVAIWSPNRRDGFPSP